MINDESNKISTLYPSTVVLRSQTLQNIRETFWCRIYAYNLFGQFPQFFSYFLNIMPWLQHNIKFSILCHNHFKLHGADDGI